MAITLTQQPGNYNLAYGINPVTLHGLTVEDKYVLQILDGSTVLADIRQTANTNGYAQFDIQNILQSYIKSSKVGLEGTNPWADSENEVFEYNIAYGTETGGVVNTPLNIAIGLKAIGGRKDYYDLTWDESSYRATAEADESDCTVISQQGKALTDWSEYRLISDISDGAPDWSVSTDKVYTQKVRRSDNFTLSVLNDIAFGPIPPNANVDKIESYRVSSFDKFGTLINDFKADNPFEFGVDNRVVTAGAGPANFTVPINALATHYYVGFPLWTPDTCPTDNDFQTDRSAMGFYRFDIIDDKCNDFTPIQFSWLNSLGFRDYFYFEKRNERSVGISRNNYLAESNNYNDNLFTSALGERGYTTFSQKLEERYVANTRFLQDYEAEFLQNLFISPDVHVRFGDDTDWFPVTLLTTSYTERNYRKDKLFQYEISFKKAHNIKSQRG